MLTRIVGLQGRTRHKPYLMSHIIIVRILFFIIIRVISHHSKVPNIDPMKGHGVTFCTSGHWSVAIMAYTRGPSYSVITGSELF